MTNAEMKTILAKSGVAEADINKVSDKFDAEKITEIIEGASNPKDALEALHTFYPELDVKKMQEQMDFIQEQFDAAAKEKKNDKPVELTEEELENVAGGGDSSQSSINWKTILIGAAIIVGAALICSGIGAGIGAGIGSTIPNLACGTMTSIGAIIPVYSGTLAGTGAIMGALIGAGVGAAGGTIAAGIVASKCDFGE